MNKILTILSQTPVDDKIQSDIDLENVPRETLLIYDTIKANKQSHFSSLVHLFLLRFFQLPLTQLSQSTRNAIRRYEKLFVPLAYNGVIRDFLEGQFYKL